MRFDRRGFLVASALVVAGCTTGPPKVPMETAATGTPTSEPPPVSSTSAAPAVPGLPAVPSRDDIVAAFAGRVPTQWGLAVNGVVQRASSSEASQGAQVARVAITLDACGGPHGSGVDQQLIDYLTSTATPATFFLNSRWIDANPAVTDQLIANPLFCIGNHGTAHVPLSVTGQSAYGIAGTASIGAAYDEVMGNQAKLTALLGQPPRYFRSGTAFYDDVCVEMVRALGLLPVNFDINSDGGATFSTSQVVSATALAKPGSICIGHVNHPNGSTYEGLSIAIPKLRAAGLTLSRLDEMTLL